MINNIFNNEVYNLLLQLNEEVGADCSFKLLEAVELINDEGDKLLADFYKVDKNLLVFPVLVWECIKELNEGVFFFSDIPSDTYFINGTYYVASRTIPKGFIMNMENIFNA